MVLLLLELLIGGYVIVRAVLPLPIRWEYRALLGAAVAVGAMKFHLTRLFGGPMFFAPELPGWVLRSGGVVFSVLFLFFWLLLTADVVRWIWTTIRRMRGGARRKTNYRRRGWVNGGLFLVALLLGLYGVECGSALPEVRRQEICIAGLPTEAAGLTVAVLADLHVGPMSGASFLPEVVRRTNELQPDLTVIVGDFVDGRATKMREKLLPLRDLKARLGVFGVPGNHEYYSGYSDYMAMFEEFGIDMLCNRHVDLFGGALVLGGVTDPHARTGRMEMPDVEKTFDGVPEKTTKILLAHGPRIAKKADAAGVQLQLSGHTHGGMMFGVKRLVAFSNGGFVSGLYQLPGGMRLLISNGTGIWNGFPLRLGVPSEIILLTLTPQSEADDGK